MSEPSTADLIAKVASALRNRIAPAAAHDAWAASELRSIDAVLELVVARLEHQAQVAESDSSALRRLLTSLQESGGPVVMGQDPSADNDALRLALERCLPWLHDGTHPDELSAVRRYLEESSLRDEQIYGGLIDRRLF